MTRADSIRTSFDHERDHKQLEVAKTIGTHADGDASAAEPEFDGAVSPGNRLPLIDDGATHTVRLRMASAQREAGEDEPLREDAGLSLPVPALNKGGRTLPVAANPRLATASSRWSGAKMPRAAHLPQPTRRLLPQRGRRTRSAAGAHLYGR